MTKEIGPRRPDARVRPGSFQPYISSRAYFSIFRDFLVEVGLENAPELLAFDAAIAAQERSLTASRRSFFAPDIVFQGSVERPFRGGANSSGSAIPPDLFPGPHFAPPNDINWTLFFDVSLPLFTSGERPAVRDQSFEDLSRIRFDRATTAQRLEQRIRSALHTAGASFAAIASGSNKRRRRRGTTSELVTDSYSRGAVSIIDLLDAQNAALVAEEAAANAVYDFLVSLMEVERSVGRIYFLVGPEEKELFSSERMSISGSVVPRRRGDEVEASCVTIHAFERPSVHCLLLPV